jgi:opine dehydrogenase
MIASVAVLGGGNAGHAIAAELSLAGLKVNLYELPQFAAGLFHETLKRREVEILGKLGEGVVRITNVTTSISEALGDAELVIVAVPSVGHKTFAELCASYLSKSLGKVRSLIVMAGNAGSLEFYKIFREKGVDGIPIGETATLPYGCRLLGPAKVMIYVKAKLLPLGVIPANETDKVVDLLSQLYNVTISCKNVLEAAINNPNMVTHPAATLLNAGRIEYAKGEFWLYKEGITPSVVKLYDAVDSEKQAICNVLGFRIFECGEPLTEMDRAIRMGLLFGAHCWEEAGLKMKGPSDLKHRYVTEDVPYGLVFISSLADLIGVPTPVIKAIITLFSVINQTDYFKEGRTVEKLGIGGLNIQQLNEYLTKGKLN